MIKFCCEYAKCDLACNCKASAYIATAESSRASFEEKAFITYFMSFVKAEIDALNDEPVMRYDFLKRDVEGVYLFEGLETLWLGWKWCYEICKVPPK